MLPLGDGSGAMGMRVCRHSGGSLLRLDPGKGYEAVAGTLVLPWVTPGGAVRTLRRTIPPPDPWRPADIDVMWSSSAWLRLSRELNAPELLDVRSSAARRTGVDWDALDATLAIARSLLRRWPNVHSRRMRRAPVELPAGMEDGPASERGLAAGALRAIPGSVQPVALEALYVTQHSPPWRSSRLHAVVAGLLALVERAIGDHAAEGLPPALLGYLAPLRAVVDRAHDPRRSPEREPSSWPPLSRELLGAAMRAASITTKTQGPGSGRAPACRVWQVYEDWVLERISTILRRILGPSLPSRSLFPMRWLLADGTCVECAAQPAFSWSRVRRLGGRRIVSVVASSLRPDVVLTVSPPTGTSRVLIIDPKDRPGLSPEEVVTESSKYLWGLRDAPIDPTGTVGPAPAVEGVVLVAPRGGPSSQAPERISRATCVAAAPYLRQPASSDIRSEPLNRELVLAWLGTLGVNVQAL